MSKNLMHVAKSSAEHVCYVISITATTHTISIHHGSFFTLNLTLKDIIVNRYALHGVYVYIFIYIYGHIESLCFIYFLYRFNKVAKKLAFVTKTVILFCN